MRAADHSKEKWIRRIAANESSWEVSFAVVTAWFDPFGQRELCRVRLPRSCRPWPVSVPVGKAVLFRCACCSKTTDQEAFAPPGKTHYRPRIAPIKEYLRTILPSNGG